MDTTKIIKSRGRPRKFSKQDGILLAKSLFHKYSFEGVSIADICKKIGVPATSIYGSFGSKFELFSLALKHDSNQLQDTLENRLQSCHNLEEIFRGSLECAVEYMSQHPEAQGCFLLDVALFTSEPKVKELVRSETALVQDMISARLKDIKASNTSEIASSIMTLIRGLSNEARMGASQDQLFITAEFYCGAFDC